MSASFKPLTVAGQAFCLGALLAAPLAGCAVFTVVDTAASVTGKALETGVDVVTAPVDLLVDDDDDEDEAKEER